MFITSASYLKGLSNYISIYFNLCVDIRRGLNNIKNKNCKEIPGMQLTPQRNC